MLNHPRKKAAPITSSSARFPQIGPSGAHPTTPPTDMHVLDDYISRFSGEWDKYEREHALIRVHNTPATGLPRRLPPLSTVPQVFFSSDFDLGQPYTFDLVTERYKQSQAVGVESEDDTAAMQYGIVLNHMLQEKLSYYSDVIEQHLIVEIGAKSAYFFDALATLRQLRTDAQSCLERTDSVAQRLDAVDAYVRDGLAMAQLQEERRRLEAQQEILAQVQTLLERRDLVRLSVQHGAFEDAMALLEDMHRTLDDPASPLRRLNHLRDIKPQLEAERAKMAESLQADFVGLLEKALREGTALESVGLECVQGAAPLHEILPPESGVQVDTASLPPEFMPVWGLLHRCAGLDTALAQYTQRVGDVLVQGVRVLVAPCAWAQCAAPGQAPETYTQPAWNAYIRALAGVLRALWLVAQRMQGVHAALVPSASQTEQQAISAATQAVWVACERIAVDVVSPRTPQLAEMEWDVFVVYDALVWQYMQRIEGAAAQRSVALRSCMLAQAKTYLSHFHRARIERAVRAIEDEVWAPAPVSPALQETVRLLDEAAHHDVPVLHVPRVLDGRVPARPASAEGDARQLSLGEHEYFVVRASGQVIHLLSDYAHVIVNLPMFAAEALGWVVEFLKQFNSRTCQVVLGAGAMRSAGLKNITARHLAIAAQSLSLMMALVPAMRGILQRYLKPTQLVLLGDFDKLQRDFREHQLEIHAKLVSIMGDRVQVHSKALAHIDVHKCDGHLPPLQDIVRETGTLYRVMAQYLQPATVQAITTRVFQDIDTRMAHAISALDVRTTEAQQLVVRDADLLNEKMHAIDPAWHGEKIRDAVKAKKPRVSAETRREVTPTLAYKARKSLGKRPPATQSPHLESIEAFQGPQAETKTKMSEKSTEGVQQPETVEQPKTEEPPPTPAKDELSKAKTPPLKAEEAQQPESKKPSAEQGKAPEPSVADAAQAEEPTAKEAKAEPSAEHQAESGKALEQEPAPRKSSDVPAEPTATPTKAVPTTPRDTPRSKGRASLEQRLAEAAKRRGLQRAAQQAQMPSTPTSGATTPVRAKLTLAERLADVAKLDTTRSSEDGSSTPSKSRSEESPKDVSPRETEDTANASAPVQAETQDTHKREGPQQELEATSGAQNTEPETDTLEDSTSKDSDAKEELAVPNEAEAAQEPARRDADKPTEPEALEKLDVPEEPEASKNAEVAKAPEASQEPVAKELGDVPNEPGSSEADASTDATEEHKKAGSVAKTDDSEETKQPKEHETEREPEAERSEARKEELKERESEDPSRPEAELHDAPTSPNNDTASEAKAETEEAAAAASEPMPAEPNAIPN